MYTIYALLSRVHYVDELFDRAKAYKYSICSDEFQGLSEWVFRPLLFVCSASLYAMWSGLRAYINYRFINGDRILAT